MMMDKSRFLEEVERKHSPSIRRVCAVQLAGQTEIDDDCARRTLSKALFDQPAPRPLAPLSDMDEEHRIAMAA